MKKILCFVLCCFLIIFITGCCINKDKGAVSYLENKEYNCEKKEDAYYCYLTKGVKKHTFKINDISSGRGKSLVYYYDDDTNRFDIQTNYLTHGGYIILEDDNNPEKCLYYVTNLEKVQCVEYGLLSNCEDSYCRSYLPQVKESVSLFVNIYKAHDIKLKIVKSK